MQGSGLTDEGPVLQHTDKEGRAGLVIATSITNSPAILRHVHWQDSAWVRTIWICGVHGWAWARQQHSSGREQEQELQFKCSLRKKVRETLAETSSSSFVTAV